MIMYHDDESTCANARDEAHTQRLGVVFDFVCRVTARGTPPSAATHHQGHAAPAAAHTRNCIVITMKNVEDEQLAAWAAASRSADGRAALLRDGTLSAAAVAAGALLNDWCG